MKLLSLLLLCVLAVPCAAGEAKRRWTKELKFNAHAAGVDRAGNVGIFGSGPINSKNRFFVGKLASDDGRYLWLRTHDNPFSFDVLQTGVIEPGGDVIVSTSDPYVAYNRRITARYSSVDGTERWKQVEYGGPRLREMVLDGKGGIIMEGFDPSLKSNVLVNYSIEDGSRQWTTPISGEGLQHSKAPRLYPAIDERGGAVAVNVWGTVTRVDGEGRLVWEKSIPMRLDEARFDSFVDMAVGNTGDVAVTFLIYETPTDNYRYSYQATRKLSGFDGRVLWIRLYQAPGPSFLTVLTSVAINSRGDVVTANHADNVNHIATFAARNGAIRSVHYERFGFDSGYIAIDTDDSSVISDVRFTQGGRRIFTTKRDREGDVLWIRQHSKPYVYERVNRTILGPGFQVVNAQGFERTLLIKYVDGATPQTGATFGIGSAYAGLRGVVNPNGFIGSWAFEFGHEPDLADGNTANAVSIPRDSVVFPVEASLANLQPDTKYYYRAIATANGNTTRGEIQSFRTRVGN
jgi:hypothetical protein